MIGLCLKVNIVNDFLRKAPMADNLLKELLVYKDGFSMSVQASHGHYCIPKEDNQLYYSDVEVGFPSKKEPLLMKYARDKSKPTRWKSQILTAET